MNRHNARLVWLWTHDLQGIETAPPEWLELLDNDECWRASQFRQEKDRIAYIAAHALLRSALIHTLKIPKASLIIDHKKSGKPFLNVPRDITLDITLSHTSGMVAVALSQAGNVGVDVESIELKHIPDNDFSAYGLGHKEIELLASLSEHERRETFIDLWTSREAVAKADGRGLSLPFSQIEIDRSLGIATIHEEGSSAKTHWTLWREQPSPVHRLALAWPRGRGELRRINEQLL
jgi:4'-phosphopantetheinyl transferase